MNKTEVIENFQSGKSLRSLARLYGRSYYAIRKLLIGVGVLHIDRKTQRNAQGLFMCIQCKKILDPSDFPSLNDSRYICRECLRKRMRRIQEKRNDCLNYDTILKSQRNKCAICDSTIGHVSKNGYRSRLAIDHDHRTGRVRGLLCNRCNRGLGYFGDSLSNLKRAVRYLENSRGE